MSVTLEHAAPAKDLRGDVKPTNVQFTWSRVIKIGGALALVGIGTYAVAADQVAIATDNAVVSAYAVTLRTPIEGIVSGAALRIGQPIDRGVVIARVENTRTDDQHLVDLQGHLARVRSTLEATTDQMQALEQLQTDLKGRSQAYVSAITARLSGSAQEAKNLLESAIVKRDMAGRTLARLSSLADRGIATTAELDKAQSDADVTMREVEAQTGHVAAIQAQLDAATHGIVSDPGSTDVAYSSQRADEISMRIGQLKHEYALAQADIAETLARLKSEEAHSSKLKEATLTTPSSGMIWKVNASDGERIGVGDSVAQIVDCNAAFIIASVPQKWIPDIEIGSEAEYRLSGDDQKRHGRVISVTGDGTGDDRNLAAIPFTQKNVATATVRIALDDRKGECLVGRTARVLLPSSGHGIAHLLNRLF